MDEYYDMSGVFEDDSDEEKDKLQNVICKIIDQTIEFCKDAKTMTLCNDAKGTYSAFNHIVHNAATLSKIMEYTEIVKTPNGNCYNPFGIPVEENEASKAVNSDEMLKFISVLENEYDPLSLDAAIAKTKKSVLERTDKTPGLDEIDW